MKKKEVGEKKFGVKINAKEKSFEKNEKNTKELDEARKNFDEKNLYVFLIKLSEKKFFYTF